MKRKKNPNSNWIKLNRAIMDDWIWKDGNKEPFDMRSAWIDLLLLAYSHDDMRIVRGQAVIIKRGEVPYSQSWLADRWGWSRGKVRRFLSTLEQDEKIEMTTTRRGTTVLIKNYAFWQDFRPSGGTTDSTSGGIGNSTFTQNERPTDGHDIEQQAVQQAVQQTDTVKNNKNNRYIEGGGRRQKNNSGRLDWIDEL